MNVTVPVAAEGETVAVNVTEEAYVEGFADEVSVVVVLVFATAEMLILAQTTMRARTRQKTFFTTRSSIVPSLDDEVVELFRSSDESWDFIKLPSVLRC